MHVIAIAIKIFMKEDTVVGWDMQTGIYTAGSEITRQMRKFIWIANWRSFRNLLPSRLRITVIAFW